MKAHSFVAINYIECSDDYRERFEYLFASRKGAIDDMPGFKGMEVLRPTQDSSTYLVVSYWENESDFNHWMQSDAFAAGHRRGFSDIQEARSAGKPAPMKSTFQKYEVISR